MSFTVASWNVNSIRVRIEQVLQWMVDNPQVDALAIQETKAPDDEFPADVIKDAGLDVVYAGQRTYNGVAMMSRNPLKEVSSGIPNYDDPQQRVNAATLNDVRIINVYVPNGSEVGSEKYAYKLEWLDAVNAYIAQQLQQYSKLVVVGDFNIAPDDRDVYDPEAWAGQVLCSEQEREALHDLLSLGLVDTFRMHHEEAGIYSWWDYRGMAFRRKRGLRIDLILASEALAKQCKASEIDKEPRRLERPSDHAPVLAAFDV